MTPWDIPQAPRDYPASNVLPLHRGLSPLNRLHAARAFNDVGMIHAIEAAEGWDDAVRADGRSRWGTNTNAPAWARRGADSRRPSVSLEPRISPGALLVLLAVAMFLGFALAVQL